jgi:hypothetical protein
MVRPKIDSNYFQERAGVHQVGGILTSMFLIFRETPNADVGIDGQVELVDDTIASCDWVRLDSRNV